ncbi:NAD(P)H-hydrate dehydratase [Endozoicomonas sp. SCSIO W0465]|uniref:NAD(P)H-hydrate dehydratase n=1 Tax=Endozoicomonas sp. SCSIO W0465 TaxID=2918516 RepID=UPI002075E169|nr:NAD(P)H-hydrate dehydratase [Endozoicomonas sp. SCSIO W0465]USE37220.1 NAD(P)H-hydrate dehydratase [Endozoicomonas sp. SCSIO W0465]
MLMNKSLPESLYTADQVRQLDHVAIHQAGIPGFQLMARAASTVLSTIVRFWPEARTLLVLCGAGNNGGDGYLVAKQAKEQGLNVSVLAFKNPAELTGDALTAWQACTDAGVVIRPYDSGQSLCGNVAAAADVDVDVDVDVDLDVVVDAMLGTGLSGHVRGDYKEAITRLNHLEKPVCAVDIPSGLCADTGVPLGVAVKAKLTVSFIGLKQGLMTGQGPEYCGELVFNSLSVPESVYQSVPSGCHRISPGQLRGWLSPRSRAAHKGDFGHVLLIGGNKGMPGAIIMAAESAIHCGAGRVTVVTRKQHLCALAARCPEVMGTAVRSRSGLGTLANGKQVIVIGPGLGSDDWGLKLLKDALAAKCPLVLDADALNLLSDHPQLLKGRKSPMIFTPHPGELARLSGLDVPTIQKNRFTAVVDSHRQLTALTAEHGVARQQDTVLLLKGAGTLIFDGQNTALCSDGNPGMAVAGMGDVLSGVIGALLAQGLSPFKAAQMAAWLHASAADEVVAGQGETGLRATELLPVIRQRLNFIIGH